MKSVVAEKWELESRIGVGAHGEVWRVRHVVTGRRKALKLLHAAHAEDPRVRARFLEEARAASSIESPHVVSVDDIGWDEGMQRPFLVMELLVGATLFDHLTQAPFQMSPGEALVVLRQVVSALDAAHAAGVIHRDLKPENVFLSWRSDGTVLAKVMDFGIAKLVGDIETVKEEGKGLLRTPTDGFLGTPGYAAPEQIVQAGAVGKTADVFSLGILTFEMLTGRRYWQTTGRELLSEVFEGAARPASERAPDVLFPKGFNAWFARACARNPAERFATVGEALAALEAVYELSDPLPAPKPRGEVLAVPETSGAFRAARVSLPSPEPVRPSNAPVPMRSRESTPERALRSAPTADPDPVPPVSSEPPLRQTRTSFPGPFEVEKPRTVPPTATATRRWAVVGLFALLLCAGSVALFAGRTNPTTTQQRAAALGADVAVVSPVPAQSNNAPSLHAAPAPTTVQTTSNSSADASLANNTEDASVRSNTTASPTVVPTRRVAPRNNTVPTSTETPANTPYEPAGL